MAGDTLARELHDFRTRLHSRLREAIAAGERDVERWVWTSAKAVRWSPFLFERERQNLPPERILKVPETPRTVHANGYCGEELRLVRCYRQGGLETLFLRELDGDRTWHAEVASGRDVVGVGVLASAGGQLERVTLIRGGRSVAWQWRQEHYVWEGDQLARIRKSIARTAVGGLVRESEILEELELVYATDGELEQILATGPSNHRGRIYQRPHGASDATELAAELTRAIVAAARLGLSRREELGAASLAYVLGQPWPPSLFALTAQEVRDIVADDDADVHDLMPAEWPSSAFVTLPFDEVGYDVDLLFQRVRETEGGVAAVRAIQHAAIELAKEPPLSGVAVYAIEYSVEDDQLAAHLDQVLAPDSPLRALLR